MRKLSFIFLLVLFPSMAWAVGTVVVTPFTYGAANGAEVRALSIAWTATAGGAASIDLSVDFVGRTDSPMEYVAGLHLTRIKTIDGVTAPTTLYDITLVEASGGDLAEGNFLDMVGTAVERRVPKTDTALALYGTVSVTETIVFTIANAGNAGQGTTILYFER